MAYAAVLSLGYTMERHTGRRDWMVSATEPIFKEFAQMLMSLQEVLGRLDYEIYTSIDRSIMDELDAKITEATWKVEDVLESYMLNQSLPRGDETPAVDEKVVEQEMDLFFKVAKVLRDEYTRELRNSWPMDDAAVMPMDDFGREMPTTVGMWDQFEEIRNELLDFEYGTKVVSLVGMAGIGKSHLARHIYQHPTILQHFDFRAWVRVGVKRCGENILFQIERDPKNSERCLIVLDDVWTIFWSNFKHWIGNRTLILVTTRLEKEVVEYPCTIHKIRFLDGAESWDLLWKNVFINEESFPPQLEKAGRKIAEICEGLPLLILTVADILRGLDKTEEYWMKVANKKTTTFEDAYEKIGKVLWLSYDYMPQRFKARFLYMGVFPQSF